MGVKGDLLALIESFLFERQERVFLMDKNINDKVKAGVYRGLILGPLFSIYTYIYIYTLMIYQMT